MTDNCSFNLEISHCDVLTIFHEFSSGDCGFHLENSFHQEISNGDATQARITVTNLLVKIVEDRISCLR